MVQKYCSELAAVDGYSATGLQVNRVGKIHLSTNCSGKKHNLYDCPKLSKAVKKQVKQLADNGEKVIICFECGEIGHFRTECPSLQEAREFDSKEEGINHSPNPADPVNTASLSKENLQILLTKIRGHGKSVSLVTSEQEEKFAEELV